MPEFFDVCRYFDNTPVKDAYTGAYLFDAQFNTFDETSPSGRVSTRKNMSVDPTFVMPPRNALTVADDQWLVGDGMSDTFMGSVVRTGYLMKKVTNQITVYTPAGLLNENLGVQMLANLEYLKDTVNGVTDAQYDPFWDIFLAPGEPVVRGSLIKIGTTIYRVRTTHRDVSGLLMAASDEIDAGSQVTVTYPTGVFDPVTETTTAGTATVPGIILDAYMLYKLSTEADAKINSGDKTLVLGVRKPVGTILTIGTQKWRVFNTTPELDGYIHHIRQA